MTDKESTDELLAELLANQKKILTSVTNIEKVLKLGLVGSLLSKQKNQLKTETFKENMQVKDTNFKIDLIEVKD